MRYGVLAALVVGVGGLAGGALASPRAAPEVNDDYPRALERARHEGKLLFVDAWAPW